jgi:hypothetical protein
MHENRKIRPVETILRMGGGLKKDDGRGEFNKIYFKNFCKCHNVLPVQ